MNTRDREARGDADTSTTLYAMAFIAVLIIASSNLPELFVEFVLGSALLSFIFGAALLALIAFVIWFFFSI